MKNVKVEGLAGVTDLGSQFNKVALAPRWLAAGKDDVAITIAYGPTGKAVGYHYRHDAQQKSLSLDLYPGPDNIPLNCCCPHRPPSCGQRWTAKATSHP